MAFTNQIANTNFFRDFQEFRRLSDEMGLKAALQWRDGRFEDQRRQDAAPREEA